MITDDESRMYTNTDLTFGSAALVSMAAELLQRREAEREFHVRFCKLQDVLEKASQIIKDAFELPEEVNHE